MVQEWGKFGNLTQRLSGFDHVICIFISFFYILAICLCSLADKIQKKRHHQIG